MPLRVFQRDHKRVNVHMWFTSTCLLGSLLLRASKERQSRVTMRGREREKRERERERRERGKEREREIEREKRERGERRYI